MLVEGSTDMDAVSIKKKKVKTKHGPESSSSTVAVIAGFLLVQVNVDK